ncbi:MAG: PAS domain S-box protein [Thermoplasmata archaeon]|nr:PAS domain S-box protein [Thermoplasmata archaeon]
MLKKKGTVLVVDDKSIVAKDIARKVKALGYAVPTTAVGSEDAVEKAGKHRPDIILIDIKLKSKKDGIETADEIFRKYEIPVIYLTAYSDEDTLERARKTQLYGYIIKPFKEKELEVNLELAFKRLKHERAIKEKKELNKILVENSVEVTWTMNPEGNFTYMSPSVEILRGNSVEEALNLTLEETLTPESFMAAMTELQSSLSKPIDDLPFSFIMELEQHKKNGTTVWTLVTIKPIFDDDGELIELQGGTFEINQRKETDGALKNQHDYFTTILDKYPEYLYVADPNTYEVLFANQKLRDLAGRPMVGGRCYEELQGLEEPCDFCTNDLILKTRMPHVWEFENKYLKRHLLITDQIIQWLDGRNVRFETAIDITDQKMIEKVLQDSELKYNSFVEQSSYGFYILDKQGNITYLNDKAKELIGQDLDKENPMNFAKFISPEDYESALKTFQEIAKGKIFNSSGVYNFKHANGEMRIMEVQILSIRRDEEFIGFHGTLVDITQRVKFEEELKEKTEFLDAVVNNTYDGIFVIDEDLNYVFINPASGKIMGHDPKEWIGKRAGIHRHPDDENKSNEAIFKALNGEPSTCEVRVKHLNGEYQLLEMRYSQMMMGDNAHILGMVNDITEKKKAVNALAASEEKYRNLFEFSPETIVIMDLESRIMECNKATAQLMELKLSEIVGKRFDELGILDSSQIERFAKMFSSMAEGKNLVGGEMELLMKGGCSKWIEIFPSPITRDGDFFAIQMIARDITDRKLAEIKMRKKLMKFELDTGNIYLSKESRASQSIEAFKELLMVGNSGIMISRTARKDFQAKIEYSFNHIKISETGKENHVQPSYKAIHEILSSIPRGHVVHIDCIEYLVSRIGPKRTLNLIHYLKDLAFTSNLIVLLSVDHTAMSEKEMRLIEKESMDILPSESLARLPLKLLDMLIYIDDMNKECILPSYSEIGEYFQLSKPTARSRIRQLNELGTVKEIQRGRMKILKLTEKGKNYIAL